MPKEKEAKKGGRHDAFLEVTMNNQEKLKANSDVRDIVRLAGNTGKSVPKRVTGSVRIDKISEEKAILAGGGEASLMGIKLKLRPTKFDMPPMPSKGLDILRPNLIQPAEIDPKIEASTQFLSPARRGIRGGGDSCSDERKI